MKPILIIICILMFSHCGFAQLDTNYIKLIPVKRSLQLHSTVKNFSVKILANQEEQLLFQNSNWGTGLYMKRSLFEFFFSIPIVTFNNFSNSNQRAFGTGFGVDYFKGRYHLNYNFRYIQGYRNLATVFDEKWKTLKKYNHVFYNQLQSHYVLNSKKFSLPSALKFKNQQLKSAGSLLIAFPVSYHFGQVKSFDTGMGSTVEDISFYRISVATAVGYGYTHVFRNWAFSAVPKIGAELRISDLNSVDIKEQYSVNFFPNFSLSSSLAYYHKRYYVGIIFHYFPEVNNSMDFDLKIVNWQVRLYSGKRF